MKFKWKFSEGRGKKIREGGDGKGDKDDSPKRERPPRDKGSEKKDKSLKKISCFLCNGPHRVFECPKKGKLAALVMEEETQEEEKEIASTTLLSAIQTKVGEQSSGRMYVEIEVRVKKIQDTGADTMYMTKKLADEISIPYKKEKGYVKGINAKSLPIYGVA